MASIHQRQDHPTYVEGCWQCRISSVSVGDTSGLQAGTDKELALYRSARAQGIQPATTKTADIQAAIEVSNRAGAAFDAGTGTFSSKGV